MMTLTRLLEGLVERASVPEATVGGLRMDSRRVVIGDAFVAVRGRERHGMEYAWDALSGGASVVLHDGMAPVPAEIASRCVEVPDLHDRLHVIAARCYGDPASALEISAVTGTNGKSSVAWLLAQALDGAMIGTLGIGAPHATDESTHTTPDLPSLYASLAALRDKGFSRVVLEASSHALDQHRLAGLRFHSTVFTNLGRDHLDYHGSVDRYGAAKRRLFFDFPSRHQLINLDDEFGRALAAELTDRPGLIGYGLDRTYRPDVLGSIRSAALDGLQVDVNTPEGRVWCRSGLIGRANASNLTIVVAELVARGHNPYDIAEIVASLTPVPGRMNRIDGPAGQRVVIDYAHTPDALAGALGALRELTPGRLICVFGCGGQRDRGKRPIMGRIAESLADEVVLTNDNPRFEDPIRILREIQAGMARPERARVVTDRRQAICGAIAGAGSSDCVLVAGKGHECTQDFGSRTIEFSDFDAVEFALTEAA